MEEFSGFSSEEEEEGRVSQLLPSVPPVPPDQILTSLPVTHPTQSPLPQATVEQDTLHPVETKSSKLDLPPQFAREILEPAAQHSTDKEKAAVGKEVEQEVVYMDTEQVDDDPSTGQVPPQLSCSSATGTQMPKTTSSGKADGRGGDRGGGRIQLLLPEGCEFFLTESGTENYICCCQKRFTEKRNLLRHYQDCANRERSTSQPAVQPGFKRRRSETSAESVDGDTVTTAHFNEDPEGARLMQCK